MEEHPIPQNVTDFEFHLVGDMTLKQFGYLAGGMIIAYVIFIVSGKTAPYIAYPLIAIFALTGVAFAFLPIQQRPLDHWLGAFLKAIFEPTQRTFKSEVIRKEDPFFKKRLTIYLTSLAYNYVPPLVQKTQPAPVVQLPTPQPSPTPTQAPKPTPQPAKKPLPDSESLQKTVDLAKEAQVIQDKIVETEKQMDDIKSQAAVPGSDPKAFSDKFQTVLTDIQKLNQEASQISQKMAYLSKTPLSTLSLNAPVKAKSIPSVTLTAVANIINGIVTDSLGNYVEAAIVVAHDKQGLPVRALKTNKLGQFIAATPLPVGTYTLSVEKDDLSFDVTEVDLKDQVLPPVIISAKKIERTV